MDRWIDGWMDSHQITAMRDPNLHPLWPSLLVACEVWQGIRIGSGQLRWTQSKARTRHTAKQTYRGNQFIGMRKTPSTTCDPSTSTLGSGVTSPTCYDWDSSSDDCLDGPPKLWVLQRMLVLNPRDCPFSIHEQ